MASANYCSGTPSLPTMPFPDRNYSEWPWLIFVCCGAGWGAPRRPWDDGGRHGWNVCLAPILLVFCVLFYMEVIVLITGNRLRSIINDNFSSFNYVALLHSTLANLSLPQSWGWSTMASAGQQLPGIGHGLMLSLSTAKWRNLLNSQLLAIAGVQWWQTGTTGSFESASRRNRFGSWHMADAS